MQTRDDEGVEPSRMILVQLCWKRDYDLYRRVILYRGKRKLTGTFVGREMKVAGKSRFDVLPFFLFSLTNLMCRALRRSILLQLV